MAAIWALALLEVQKIDQKIRGIRTHLELLPKERKRIAADKAAIDAKAAGALKQLQECESAIHAMENEVASIGDKIAKLKQQSALVKKNTEYQVMISEVELCNQRIAELEEKILAGYDDLEKRKALYLRKKKLLAGDIAALKKEWLEFDALETELKEEIVEQEKKRAAAASRIESDLIRRYNELLGNQDSTPLTRIENDMCGNCFLKLTPQTMTLARRGSVAYCDHCSHMVYLEDL